MTIPGSRIVSPSLPIALAIALMLAICAGLASAETAADGRLRQLAGQAASYAGEVRALLAKGADPNVPDPNGRTAVHGAASIGAVESMQALLEAGGDPNRRDKDGNTPLHIAAAASSPILVSSIMSSVRVTESIALIRVMLSARADANIANDDGQTGVVPSVVELAGGDLLGNGFYAAIPGCLKRAEGSSKASISRGMSRKPRTRRKRCSASSRAALTQRWIISPPRQRLTFRV